jgi:hypothetical protein
MVEMIKVDDLVPGDVIMYSGTTFICRAIQLFDGTEFSHAALYLGDGMVGEAVATGLELRPFEAGVPHNPWIHAQRLKDVVPDMTPVLDVANQYLAQGNRYGYEQLLLLAFLCLTRKLRFAPSLAQLIRQVLDAAAAVLTRMISQKREPMICSEFVYRCYDEAMAAPDDVYSVWVNRLQPPPAAAFAGAPSAAIAFAGATAPAPLPSPACRGSGVHPESLLALLNSTAGSAWIGAPTPGVAFAATPRPEPAPALLDEAIATYLEEIREPPKAVGPDVAMLADLRDATHHFAARLYAASSGGNASGAREVPALSAPSAAAMVSGYLTRVMADFVTPADLYMTPSFYRVGRLET